MTKRQLFYITVANGLTLAVDRIVTGTETAGFHQFEFTGPPDNLSNALRQIRHDWPDTTYGLVCIRTVNNPEHPEHGKQYLEVDSFWVGS